MGWDQFSFNKNVGALDGGKPSIWHQVPDVEAYQKFLKTEAKENECWCYTCAGRKFYGRSKLVISAEASCCPIPEYSKTLIEQLLYRADN